MGAAFIRSMVPYAARVRDPIGTAGTRSARSDPRMIGIASSRPFLLGNSTRSRHPGPPGEV